jgi:hypothetical protein
MPLLCQYFILSLTCSNLIFLCVLYFTKEHMLYIHMYKTRYKINVSIVPWSWLLVQCSCRGRQTASQPCEEVFEGICDSYAIYCSGFFYVVRTLHFKYNLCINQHNAQYIDLFSLCLTCFGLILNHLQGGHVQKGSWLLSPEYGICSRARIELNSALSWPISRHHAQETGKPTANLYTCLLKMGLI